LHPLYKLLNDSSLVDVGSPTQPLTPLTSNVKLKYKGGSITAR